VENQKTPSLRLVKSDSSYVGGNEERAMPVERFGGGGDNGDMESRLRAVEQAIVEIRTVLPTLATKTGLAGLRAELHQSINSQTWKILGGCAALVTAVYFIARYVT